MAKRKSRRARGGLPTWQNIVVFVALLAGLVLLKRWSQNYNLPGQNVLVPLLAMLVLAYQAHNLGMKYARDMLLALVVMLGVVTPSYSEPGSYSPLAYLSFVLDAFIFWAVTMGLAKAAQMLLD